MYHFNQDFSKPRFRCSLCGLIKPFQKELVVKNFCPTGVRTRDLWIKGLYYSEADAVVVLVEEFT